MGNNNWTSRDESVVLSCDPEQVKTWTISEVGKWLQGIGFGQYKSKIFEKQDIDGEVLLHLDAEKIQRLGVTIGNSTKIYLQIEALTKGSVHNQTSFSNNEKLLELGLKKMEKMKGLAKLSAPERKEKISKLVIKEELLNSYLSKDFVATRKEIVQLMETSTHPLRRAESETKMLASTTTDSQPLTEESEDLEQQEVEEMKRVVQQIDTLESMAKGTPMQLSIKTEEFLKVKLVIVELDTSDTHRNFRKVLSPLMDSFNVSMQFGFFHSALIVGPWYLEWNDTGLVVPRKCYSGAAVLAADVQKYYKGPQVEEALDKISNVICHWNAHYTYSRQKHNCQTFVDELCNVLEIDINFKGALGKFLDQLRTKGVCEMSYPLSEHLQSVLETNESSMNFATHHDLDDFVRQVRMKDPSYFECDAIGQDDWILLKSYDRAFWLRHLKNRKSKEYEPYLCPFGNPTSTGSIIDSNYFTYQNKKS